MAVEHTRCSGDSVVFFAASRHLRDSNVAVGQNVSVVRLSRRYLRSVVQNLQLIQRFKRQIVDHSPQRERLNFWMDIIVEATQGTTNRLRFPVPKRPPAAGGARAAGAGREKGSDALLLLLQVLILEPTKVYQPSYVSINNQAEEKNVSIWHVSPAETVRIATSGPAAPPKGSGQLRCSPESWSRVRNVNAPVFHFARRKGSTSGTSPPCP